MIQLIACNGSDMRAYYNGCTLMYVGGATPIAVNVQEVINRTTLRVYANRKTFDVNRADLRVKYFEPFYTDSGELVGTRAQRSYKRAPIVDNIYLQYLNIISDSGLKSTFNGTQGRLGAQFFVTQANRITVLLYLGELVGFFRDNMFYVKDVCIAERLRELIKKEELPYGVVQASA
jgi:hypothetical protein